MPPADTLSQAEKSGKIKVEPGIHVWFREQGWSGRARHGQWWDGLGTKNSDSRPERQGRQENMIN